MATQCCTIRFFLQWSLEYLCLTQSFPVNSENISTYLTQPKSKFFGLESIHFCCRQYGCNFNHYDLIGTNVMEFGEIMQNNGDHAVQDISRITVLVPMKSLYATSYASIIVTYLVSCISEIRWIICPIFTVDRVWLLPIFYALIGGKPLHSSQNLLETTKKLETSSIVQYEKYFDILDHLGSTH